MPVVWQEITPDDYDTVYAAGLVAHTTGNGYLTSPAGEEVSDDYLFTAYVKRDDGVCLVTHNSMTRDEFDLLDINAVTATPADPDPFEGPEVEEADPEPEDGV